MHLGRFTHLRPLPVMVSLWWGSIGIWLLMPWDTFDSSPAYATLLQFGDEGLHGVVSVIVAGLIASPWLPAKLRNGALFAAMVMALGGALAFGTANWRGLSIPIWGTVSVGTIWAFFQGADP